MAMQMIFSGSEYLYLKDPTDTEVGKKLLQEGSVLMNELGYEDFTFKKLAHHIHSTEATLYRYFHNKHRFLLYLLSWFWHALAYLISIETVAMPTAQEKIERIIAILLSPQENMQMPSMVSIDVLNHIAINEYNKAYRTKEVDDLNRHQLYKPYKDLCHLISNSFKAYNPNYPYTHSLASTLIEMSVLLPYFAEHLPSLVDSNNHTASTPIEAHRQYLTHLIFHALQTT